MQVYFWVNLCVQQLVLQCFFEFQRNVIWCLNFIYCYQVEYSPIFLYLEIPRILEKDSFCNQLVLVLVLTLWLRKLSKQLSRRMSGVEWQENCRNSPISLALEKNIFFSIGYHGKFLFYLFFILGHFSSNLPWRLWSSTCQRLFNKYTFKLRSYAKRKKGDKYLEA